MNCPFCKGRGKVATGDAEFPWLTCDNCSATGDLDTMKLVRAYRLGRAHERARWAAQLAGVEYVESAERDLDFRTIEAAVIDDARRQRYEEALAPGSPQRRALEADVERLLREREPLLRGLAAMADGLRVEREALGA